MTRAKPTGASSSADDTMTLTLADAVPAVPVPVQTGADRGWVRKRPVAFRLADLIDELAARVTLRLKETTVIRRDLKRYYAALEQEVAALAWSPVEWQDARRALAGNAFNTPNQVRMMWAHAAEVLGLDSPITRKMHRAPLVRLYAILDRLESMDPDVERGVPAVVEGPVVAVAEKGPGYAWTPSPQDIENEARAESARAEHRADVERRARDVGP